MTRRSNSNVTEICPIFNGWKDIASYLGKGVRTVQRYESHIGLPVRRPTGRSRGAVLATKAELDAWVSASPIREMYSVKYVKTVAGRASTGAEIAAGLEQMRKLRTEMRELQREVMSTLHLLSESVREVSGLLTSPYRMANPNFDSGVRGIVGGGALNAPIDSPLHNVLQNILEHDRNDTLVTFRRRKAN